MDYEDNDARDQNLHLVGESSSKVSSVLHSYTLPKFDFDNSLQGHLIFDSLVENEVFLGITSQEDNQWIEEYSCGTSAVESTRKNVWSEATSSESVAMLLKSVGQEEKVPEESDKPGSLINVMDSNFEDNFAVSKMSSECEQSQETQISGADVDSVVIGYKCKSSAGEETNDKTCDDVNQEAGKIANQSFINKLQEDPSVSKVECGNAGSSQNIDASVEECRDNPQELVNNSSIIEYVTDHIIKSKENIVEKLSVDSNVESLAVEDSNTESKIHDSHLQSYSVEETEIGVGSDNNIGKISITAECSAEMSAEDISHKDEAPENSALKVYTGDLNDKTQSLEPDANTMDQDVTLNKRVDTILPLDYRDMNLDVVGASVSHKNIEPSLSAEGCEGVVAMAQGSESNLTIPTDSGVAAVVSRKISSPLPPNGAQLPSETAVTDDDVTEDQPRSPILGVRLLHDVNEEKVQTPEVDNTVDSALDDPLPVVIVSDGAVKVVHELAGHCDPPVGNLNAGPSEQTAEENPDDLSAKGYTNAEEEAILNPKESMSGEDGAVFLKLGVNTSDAQPASVDVDVDVDVVVAVAGPSELDTDHVVQKGGGSLSLDKPQMFSLSDTKSIELFQVAKDKLEIAPVPKFSNDGNDLQSVSSSSATKEEKSFTFEVSASAAGQTVIQNNSFSKNMKVSSVNPSGSQLDPIKLHEYYLVSPQTPSSAATEAGPKEKSERKPRKKSVGRETTKKGSHLKETSPAKRSRKVEKSPPLLTLLTTGHVTSDKKLMPNESVECSKTPIYTSNLPDLNNSTSLCQHLFTDSQQVQLRAQILVYGSLLSGMPPEEAHMITAFGHSDGGRRAWEAAWHACLERVRGSKSQPNNPSSSTPDQGTKIGSAQSKILSGVSSPIVSPMIPISSPLWNISTLCDGSQPNALPRNALFDYRQTLSPLHIYQTPQVQNFGGHNLSWLSQGPSPSQWVTSSPITCFSALPITESVKLTTVKELGASSIPVIPVDPNTGPRFSTGQPSSDLKSRKRKKVATTEGYNQISFLAQNQTKSGTAVTPAALSTPISINSKINSGNLSSASRLGDQNISKIATKEEISGKIDESKLQAADAAVHAAAAISHCQDVWNQLEKQKNLGLVSDDEAKLASSAVSIVAASSVAKVAAAAAKIASNVAEQARLMADEVFQSSRTGNNDQSSMISHDKATSVISAARDAARRRIEAASAASKHAENLDAILKAAELAAEAVLQAGKIVAMGNPLSLKVLVEAGPEGYWKTPESSNPNVETTPNNKEIQTLKHGLSLQEDSGDLAKNMMMIIDGISGSVTSNENVIPESEFGSVRTSDVDQNMPQSTSGAWKDIIKEGCLVEVCKETNKKKGAWFTANVLALKDGKALVCYTEIQSDEGSGKFKEWVPVPLEVEGTEAPTIRIAHPMTTLGSEGAKKRGRTALTDYAWCSGDRVDVWVHNCWCEAVVMATNKIDVTSLTVQFPAQGDTSIVRSWHVRPTLIWKDHKWIEWSSLKESRSSEGDTPHQKRQKFITPVVEDKEKDKPSNSVNLVESGRNQESRIPFSAQGSSFDVGKSSRNENKLDTRRTMKSGLQKKRSRVVFGVPKPGKKQKFMDVSTQYVADVSLKNSTPNDSVKLDSQIMPHAQGSRGSKNNSKNDVKEKQAVEIKSKALKSRKPPIPSVRSLAQKDKLKPSKTASHDSVSVDENLSGNQNQIDFGSSSNTEDAKETSTSKTVSQRLNKGKIAHGDRMAIKVEVKEKSTSEAEIRRSNRRIQPTSRLLEGLQSSLTLSKTPSASHASQRSHNKLTPKGCTNPS